MFVKRYRIIRASPEKHVARRRFLYVKTARSNKYARCGERRTNKRRNLKKKIKHVASAERKVFRRNVCKSTIDTSRITRVRNGVHGSMTFDSYLLAHGTPTPADCPRPPDRRRSGASRRRFPSLRCTRSSSCRAALER